MKRESRTRATKNPTPRMRSAQASSNHPMSATASGAQKTAPSPAPAESIPDANPLRSGKKRMRLLMVAPG